MSTSMENIALSFQLHKRSNEWKKGIDGNDYDSIRELSVFLKGEGMKFNDLAPLVRLNNYIKKSGADFDQVESFIANVVNSKEPQKLIDTTNQNCENNNDPAGENS